MPLATPKIIDISDNIVAQLELSLSQTIPLLPKSFQRVLAKVLAGVFIVIWKYCGFIFLQQFVSTASTKETIVNGKTIIPLIEWGRLIGVGDPTPATNAELLIDITVTNQTGTLPINSQLVNSDNGVTYITLGAVALSAPVVQATIKAVSDQSGGGGAGALGNLNAADIVSFANPLPNVARNASVVSQSVTAADAEDLNVVYRQRVTDRWQKRLQGGALADYEAWGEELAGILFIYPYTSTCPGQVDVYVEATIASSGSPDGIPTPTQLQAVLDNINLDVSGLATRRPAGALVNTFAITRSTFDVVVNGLIVDNPTQVQADITSAVTNYFIDREPFIEGVSILPRKDRITRSGVGGVVDDIVSTAGGIFLSVTMTSLTIPIETYTLGVGEKAKALTVTFI